MVNDLTLLFKLTFPKILNIAQVILKPELSVMIMTLRKYFTHATELREKDIEYYQTSISGSNNRAFEN